MSGPLIPLCLTLANGLRVRLISDPLASRAAALVQLTAGSHDEPDEWPGLAHLLEHVVFSGSKGYQEEHRLMSWAQAEGAKLNATTHATSTSWFFDSPMEKLSEGLARLVDMLAYPLLSPQAIQQEVAVIDAEYRMLASHADTQREAALAQTFVSPPALQRFHVGNRNHFGDNSVALQQALQRYHRHFFSAQNMTLWLQGPCSVERLTELAETYGSRFANNGKAPEKLTEEVRLRTDRYFRLRIQDAPRLSFAFPLHPVEQQDCQPLTLLRQLLTDEAQGSLLAVLREKGYCDNLQVSLPYYTPDAAILRIEFEVTDSDSALSAAIEAIFTVWLSSLARLDAAQLQHYRQLAGQDFTRLTPIDQLRARAFGFAPVSQSASRLAASWPHWISQLTPENMTRLWVSPEEQGTEITVQGFTLSMNTRSWAQPPSAVTSPAGVFYSAQQPIAQPFLPPQRVTLPHIQPDSGTATLLLSPVQGRLLSPRLAYAIQASLRTIVGQCKHAGGQLRFTEHQGEWLLELTASHDVMLSTLAEMLVRIAHPSASQRAQGERLFQAEQQRLKSDIAVRYLLNQLPAVLFGEDENGLPPWQATLYGGDRLLCDALSRLLSSFPAAVNPPAQLDAMPQPQQLRYLRQTAGNDAAVVLFCPLVEATADCLTAWRILAALFGPRFFQQLRVEKNLGYVVTSRFHQAAGIAGILFAIQSPETSVAAIRNHLGTFIDEVGSTVAGIKTNTLAEKSLMLRSEITPRGGVGAEQARQHWLQLRGYAPPVDETSLRALTPDMLYHYYQRLNQERQRWWWLDNGA
ncbi:hypothetical protein ED28_14970 [[Pantoea] beijingensis]|uniref:Coenzyme PQQ synthesis protein F n=1 Tax=[Pantoea] beijingensis TaxID=1324864 RepID=A0A443IAH5_9GAMM|nr:pyrroloquinoline quinone biosynthesis protein PqqF [[Pantoea] beijingensis]RWR01221.1 hypothetical protein ED28_14970 [[Pantoea] beijingensis]